MGATPACLSSRRTRGAGSSRAGVSGTIRARPLGRTPCAAKGCLDDDMRILVIGGTRFIGRHFVEAALGAGHDVTLVHRSPTTLFPSARHVLDDRNGDLSALADGEWDAT